MVSDHASSKPRMKRKSAAVILRTSRGVDQVNRLNNPALNSCLQVVLSVRTFNITRTSMDLNPEVVPYFGSNGQSFLLSVQNLYEGNNAQSPLLVT